LPVLAAADDPGAGDLACSVARGSADLRVDGSLSDWDSRIVAQPLRWSRTSGGEPPDASTATALCLADDRFLHLGVAISARSLHFGTMPFNEAWRSDSVEVFFSSQAGSSAAHIRTGLIRVSADTAGRVIMEGTGAVTDGTHVTRKFSYPLLWDALGAKSGLQRTPLGYTVEIAVPRALLGWADGLPPTALSLNVRVHRSCGKTPCQAVLESSDDPYNTSPASDERYRPVSFQELALKNRGGRAAPAEESLQSLVYQALTKLDALDPTAAAQILQESPDRRVMPILASASIAAGQFGPATETLELLGGTGSPETLRLWAAEHAALLYSLQGSPAEATAEYEKLIAVANPAFQDIGVAGVIDVDVANGEGESALASYQAAFAGLTPAGTKSASRIAHWLTEQKRAPEAIAILNRFLASERATDGEKAWGLLQLQLLYARVGKLDESVATAWQLQAIAPPGDPGGEAGFPAFVSAFDSIRAAAPGSPSFLDAYSEFLARNPLATDPAREIALAGVLQGRQKLDEAAALYQKVIGESTASQPERASAMLALQRLRQGLGLGQLSAETGLAIQRTFPQDFSVRFASWKLLRSSCRAGGEQPAVQRVCSTAGDALAADLRSGAQKEGSPENHRARSLLLQLDKENLR